MAKNLTFKLILDGENQGLLTSVKQAEAGAKAAFNAIKQEATNLSAASNAASKATADAISPQLAAEARAAQGSVAGLSSSLSGYATQADAASTGGANAASGTKAFGFSLSTLASSLSALGLGAFVVLLGQTADTYTNLSARIKIATGDNGDFAANMAGVQRIALATYAPLSDTADLFSSIARATKDLGLSQQKVLDITQTIQQAAALSGGAMESQQAAIQQLNQALASGVLRGEEFNSIGEQLPYLMTILQKSLGVTQKELRDMADAGLLTTQVVLGGIQKLGGETAAEFEKMPLNIGKAIQNIKTQWMILIGDLDQSEGTSQTVAQGIKLIGDNLGILKTFIDDAAAGVKTLYDQFGNLLSSGDITALKDAVSAAYEAFKQFGETLAETVGSALDVVVSGSTTFSALLGSLGGEATTADERVSFFTRTLQGLTIAIGVLNDGFAGIGIAVKLLVGAFFDLAGAANSVLAAVTWGDVSKQFTANADVMKAKAKEYYAEAKKDALEFESAAMAAVKESAKTQKQRNAEELADAKAKFAAITTEKELSDEKQAYSDAKKLEAAKAYAQAAMDANNGVLTGTIQADLAAQNYIATIDKAGKLSVTAWTDTSEAAKYAGLSADEAATKAAQSLGVDLVVALNQVTTVFTQNAQAITTVANGYDALKAKGVDAAELLNASLLKLLDQARSAAEIDIVRQQFVQFGQDGKLSTDMVAAGMQAINDKVNETPGALSKTQEAFKLLGLTMKAEAVAGAQAQISAFEAVKNSGEASTAQLTKALINMGDKIYASGDAAKIAWYEAQLRANDLSATVSNTGSVSVAAMTKTEVAVTRVANATGIAERGFVNLGATARAEAASVADSWQAATDAWAASIDRKTAADKQQREQRQSLSVQTESYTLKQIYDQIKALGYSDSQAAKLAETAFRQAQDANRSSAANARASGQRYGDLSARSLEAALAQGYAFGSKPREFINNLKLAASKSASTGMPSLKPPSGLIGSNPTTANIGNAPTKTVNYNLSLGGTTASVMTDEAGANALDEIMSQLENFKRGS